MPFANFLDVECRGFANGVLAVCVILFVHHDIFILRGYLNFKDLIIFCILKL